MYRFIRRKDLPYILFTMILGSLDHFLYEFSAQNPVTALIAPVNESVWEHMKLLFFPFLLFSLIEYCFRRPEPAAFFGSRFAGVWTGMLSIIFLYYGYSGILGKSFVCVDILLFFVGVLITYSISFRLRKRFQNQEPLNIFLWWAFTVLLFFFFTCFPPEFPIFLSPDA